jgi:hypothetical protein
MDVPKTTDSIPVHKIAPWHIGQGSAVVYITSLLVSIPGLDRTN